MTGREIAAIASNASRNPTAMPRAVSLSPNSSMSAPAANARSLPVTTTAFTAASAASARGRVANGPEHRLRERVHRRRG